METILAEYESTFPHLKSEGFRITSPDIEAYNCFAWAAGEANRMWMPTGALYWPPGVPLNRLVATVTQVYATLGFEPAADARLVPGLEKLALFTKGSTVEHVARQLPSGKWTSKLGYDGHDIEHTLKGLTSAFYGAPTHFLARPR